MRCDTVKIRHKKDKKLLRVVNASDYALNMSGRWNDFELVTEQHGDPEESPKVAEVKTDESMSRNEKEPVPIKNPRPEKKVK